MSGTHILLLAVAAMLATGCGRDTSTSDPEDGDGGGSGGGSGGGDGGGGGDDGCEGDSQCADWEICESDECIDGDRNNTIDEAETLLWESSVEGYLNPDEDIDYYTFEADGGEFVRISTDHDYEDGNTVVSLYRSNGKLVSESNEYANEWGVSGSDSVVYAYLAEAGTYVIMVQDYGTYEPGADQEGDPDYEYALELSEWSNTTSDPDSMDEPGTAILLDDDYSFHSYGALLEDEGDIDYITITNSLEGAILYLDGNQNMDGSDATARVQLYNEDGDLLTDKSEVGPEGYALFPVIDPGEYVVALSDAEGGGGDDHWLFLHLLAGFADPAYDLEDEPNDGSGDATTLSSTEYENSSGLLWTRAKGEGFIDAADDADWFEFEAPYKESNIVVCLNSAVWGSQAVPDIEVYDSGGDLLDSADGDSSYEPNANIESIPVDLGTYYLKVVPPDDATGGPDQWYRFYVYAASFEISSYAEGGYSCP